MGPSSRRSTAMHFLVGVGVGVLFVRHPSFLRPLMYGGDQQRGKRPGTESVAMILSLVDAFVATNEPTSLRERMIHFESLSGLVWDTLAPFVLQGLVLPTGPNINQRSPHHVSFCIKSIHRSSVLAAMQKKGVIASGGSACTASADLPSHVLVAMKVPLDFIHGSIQMFDWSPVITFDRIRITFSYVTKIDDVRSILCPVLRDRNPSGSSQPDDPVF